MKYLILFIVISGCAPIYSQISIHPDFTPYVEDFIYTAKQYNQDIEINNLIIEYENLPRQYLGMCYYGNLTPKITISSKRWKNLDETRKKAVIYHELGHCIFKKNHSNDKNSIMYHKIEDNFEFTNENLADFFK